MTDSVADIIAFWYLSAMAVSGGVGVILLRNPVHSALSLVYVIFHVAGLFVILGAGFLAVVQIIVYAGAIVVLFLFTLMMLDMRGLQTERFMHRQRWVALPLAIALAVEVVFVGIGTPEIRADFLGAFPPQAISDLGGSTQAIASVLFSEYLLPFEIASVLLLVAAVGAIVLARRFDLDLEAAPENKPADLEGPGANKQPEAEVTS